MFQPRLLAPAPAKVIVWRMLNNVKRAWLERTQGERAARAVDLLLQLHPDHPGELRARATILSALGAYRHRSYYVMRTDALDRLGTRLEHRMTAAQIRAMMAKM